MLKKQFLLWFEIAFNIILVSACINVLMPSLFAPSFVYASSIPSHKIQEDQGIDASKACDMQVLFDREYYKTLMNDLSNAKKNIVVVMYVFKPTGYASTLPDHIINMLIKKHAQGVDVSVVLNIDDKSEIDGTKDDLNQTNLKVAKRLQSNGIAVYLDSPGRTTHAKIVVIDNRIVYIGSHNFTQSALKYNHEVSVRIISSDTAKRIVHYVEDLEHEK